MVMYWMVSREQFPQAEALDKALAALGEKMDYAINVDVPDENIVKRMGGRRACVGCGATYHIAYAAPKQEDICDVCGKELILRDDDKPETGVSMCSETSRCRYHEADPATDRLLSSCGNSA